MAKLIVEVSTIDEIHEHPNADQLELAQVRGWNCVVRKGIYKPGDKCLYIPIDAVLPNELEELLFEGAKVKLSKGRIKTIKLRGAVSQGLVVDLKTVGMEALEVGTDVASLLKITKYEPPVRGSSLSGNARPPRYANPNFKKYTSIENIKNYNKVFKDGEIVVITEKIHGTNFRCGWVPYDAVTLWQKLRKLIGLAPKWEFVYGSHNVQLDSKFLTYDNTSNVYANIVRKYNLKEKLEPGCTLYGEIYGEGIQKNYDYGLKRRELAIGDPTHGAYDLVVFDASFDGQFLNPVHLVRWCHNMRLPMVPLLYTGPWSREIADKFVNGASVLNNKQKVREGIVIKPAIEATCIAGRKVLKYISDAYLLLKGNTDYH